MRKQYLFFLIVLAVSFLLFSCLEKGGTIEVTNQAEGILGGGNLIVIVKGYDFSSALSNIQKTGEQLAKGATKSFHKDEDGVYTVVALFPSPMFTQVVTLLAGNKVGVIIK